MLDAEKITSRLLDLNHRVNILILDSVESTNLMAKELIQNGRNDIVVIAQAQTAGRGRLERSWRSPPGGLYVSLSIQPEISPNEYPLITLIAGCAVVEVLRGISDVPVSLKWPNDLMIRGKKLGGILSELVITSDDRHFIVVGIGVNINFPVEDLHSDLISTTETLQSLTGQLFSLEEIIIGTIDGILKRVSNLERCDDVYSIIDEWTSFSSTIGQRVRVDAGSMVHTGLAIRITQSGSLVVVDNDESEIVIDIGDVSHLRHSE
ncbi:MAG: biotin--[acetyl-CoA-carboxylase] ligase [Candidatus Thorarchaeota archaeon]